MQVGAVACACRLRRPRQVTRARRCAAQPPTGRPAPPLAPLAGVCHGAGGPAQQEAHGEGAGCGPGPAGGGPGRKRGADPGRCEGALPRLSGAAAVWSPALLQPAVPNLGPAMPTTHAPCATCAALARAQPAARASASPHIPATSPAVCTPRLHRPPPACPAGTVVSLSRDTQVSPSGALVAKDGGGVVGERCIRRSAAIHSCAADAHVWRLLSQPRGRWWVAQSACVHASPARW